MRELTGSDRKYLRSLAHSLEPVVFVGKQGLTETLVAALDQALESHELVKVKFNDHKDEKKEIAAALGEQTGSDIAGIIGNVAILYREQVDEEKRKIRLPYRER
jgi:RNA-binding protein